MIERLRRRALEPVDPASLVLFRVLFGVLLFAATLRFLAHGWVREHYLAPKVNFPFWGLSWLQPLPGIGMYLVFGVMAVAALGIALGAYYRLSSLLFALLFSYSHAIDKTYYLNHYYLVSLLAVLMVLLPLHQVGSLDSHRQKLNVTSFPRWMVWLLRFQVGCVYLFGGIAKLGSDWLLHAQPLTIWLSRNQDVFLIGPLLMRKQTAYFMSWAGMLFDLSVPLLLSLRRTRLPMYGVVVGFHVVTARLFPIGMFPLFMSLFALIFFPPQAPRTWPRWLFGAQRWLAHKPIESDTSSKYAGGLPMWLVPYVSFQLLFPLRAALYPGSSLWTDEGYRYAWHVMLAEKNGYVEVRLRDKGTGRQWQVRPEDYLTPQQLKQLATQPDMLLQFAKVIRADYAARGVSVEVHISSLVSLNGRPSAPLIDSSVDLAQEYDGFAPKRWILPLHDGLEPRF